MKGAKMFYIKLFCLILVTLFLINCTYTILENRHNKSCDIIEEQPETVNVVYNPVVIIQPIKPGPRPPKTPIPPYHPVEPGPVINEPIKETIQPNKENPNKKRDFDKRISTDMKKGRNTSKTKE
jgi:hypothetical protein